MRFLRWFKREPPVVINLHHVHSFDPDGVDWAKVAARIRAELLRDQRRGGGGAAGIK